MWGTVKELLDVFLRIAGALGLPAIFLYLLSDRRRARAEGTVAEKTVDVKVKTAEVGQIEAHMIAVERAIAMERSAKDEQIQSLHDQLTEAKVELTETKVELAETKAELAEVRAELNAVRAELMQFKHQMGRD